MNAAKPPTPAEVEARALEYHNLDIEIETIAKKAADDMLPKQTRQAELKTWLLEQARQFGSTHGEKSKMLHGIDFEAMVTIGQSSSIDAAAVETFRLALVKAEKQFVLQHCFEKTIRWTLSSGAAAYIREHRAKLTVRLLALYAQCTVTKDKTPKLDVRPKQKAAA